MEWRAKMRALYESLQFIGQGSLDGFWFPLSIWTLVAVFAFLFMKAFKNLNPLYHYHLRVATLAAIPFGLASSVILQGINSFYSDYTTFESAIFIVESPISYSYASSIETTAFTPNWFEPNFLLGALSTILFAVSFIMIIRLIWSYVELKKLHQSLTHTPLNAFERFESLQNKEVKVAYHNHPLVPFTFGWKQPIIVLPNSIKDDQEKVRMAIQHELIHIQRGDYLLQLLLSVIESIFWFHPLIHFGSREIEMYREISCDHEVLNTSGISKKGYASMLYELVPLNRGMGSFSVSMAVQSSTLKKRIETMKYHKLHKSSLKRSILFLILMITAVTLPIACSDMRGPQGLSPEELENTTLEMKNISITINDLQIVTRTGGSIVTANGMSSMFFNAGEYGIFKISPLRFNEGKPVGEIIGNTARFSINEMDVLIESETDFFSDIDKTEIWVEHLATKSAGFSYGVARNSITLQEYFEEKEKTRFTQIDQTKEDYFVVVEEMPQLIGGLASIQSKVQYPEMAKRAGIEGRVTVQFIVNENGDVENPKIIRGIGGGCDEAALEAVQLAKFEPGIQRGQPVRVQYSLPIIFRLSDTNG